MCKLLCMRTNIEIDDELMAAALEASGAKTKREVVERGLRELVDRRKRMGILELFGAYPDFPTLDEIRPPDPPYAD